MYIKFSEQFSLPVEEVYSKFQTPADWARVFGFPGDSKDLGEGWYAVSLKNFPFPLVVKHVVQEPDKLVRWIFRGFWRGQGEVRFARNADGVLVEGFEEIAVRPLFFFSVVLEKLLLERVFRKIWGIGWHRLRKIELSRNGAKP